MRLFRFNIPVDFVHKKALGPRTPPPGHGRSGQTALVVLIGSGAVFGAALTAASHSRLHRVTHMFVIFTVALIHNRVVWLRVLAGALVLALALRLMARFQNEESNVTFLV